MKVHAIFFKKVKYYLNIYLSSLCGHYVRSYRKVKQRLSEYLSMKAKLHGGGKKHNSKEKNKIYN